MIVIKELHGGRFGNKILHYNNLVQIAKHMKIDWNSVPYNEYSVLELENNLIPSDIITTPIDSKMDFSSLPASIDYELKPCLGELFFKFTSPTRGIFKPKSNILNNDLINIGIHFRGGDFHSWNPESILSTDYYIDAIKHLHKTDNKYLLFTDDLNLKSYQDVKKYLNENRYDYELGVATDGDCHFINDFFQLCDCDYIISSPSTFAICAGFMGKEKEIIHSKQWVNSRVAKNDGFWMGVANGGNDNYKINKLI